ncbi:hypothetical protein BDR22DRAFT_907877 [Usnea florida]
MAGREESGRFPPPKYPQYFPSWTPDHKYPPLEPFDHYDHAKDADPTFPILKRSACIKNLTPTTGSAVTGLQLSSLTSKAKDEIALLVAKRKVVVFRSQDLKDLPIAAIVDFCKYFGPLLIFPLGPYLPDHPEIHIAHNGGGDNRFRDLYASRTTSLAWHIDNSANPQPSGLVFLYMLECPDAGGDTIFVNMAEAYNKLSNRENSRCHWREMLVCQPSVYVFSPIQPSFPTLMLTTHPSTSDTKRIIGLKKEESDALLKFLFDHLTNSQDCQVRVQWTDDTVVIFDNRATAHTAIFDFVDDQRRHLARLSPAAGKPFETPFRET